MNQRIDQIQEWNLTVHLLTPDILTLQVNDPDAELWMVSLSCFPLPERIVELYQTVSVCHSPHPSTLCT